MLSGVRVWEGGGFLLPYAHGAALSRRKPLSMRSPGWKELCTRDEMCQGSIQHKVSFWRCPERKIRRIPCSGNKRSKTWSTRLNNIINKKGLVCAQRCLTPSLSAEPPQQTNLPLHAAHQSHPELSQCYRRWTDQTLGEKSWICLFVLEVAFTPQHTIRSRCYLRKPPRFSITAWWSMALASIKAGRPGESSLIP